MAWRHAVDWVEKNVGLFDRFVSLPATSPLRNKFDVEKCIAGLDDETDCVVGITKSRRSPWFNMVSKTNKGYITRLIDNKRPIHRRQDVPITYDLTTVAYVTRPDFIKSASGIFDGQLKGIELPEERSLDIDTNLDFQIAEYLMSQVSGG